MVRLAAACMDEWAQYIGLQSGKMMSSPEKAGRQKDFALERSVLLIDQIEKDKKMNQCSRKHL